MKSLSVKEWNWVFLSIRRLTEFEWSTRERCVCLFVCNVLSLVIVYVFVSLASHFVVVAGWFETRIRPTVNLCAIYRCIRLLGHDVDVWLVWRPWFRFTSTYASCSCKCCSLLRGRPTCQYFFYFFNSFDIEGHCRQSRDAGAVGNLLLLLAHLAPPFIGKHHGK